MLQTSLKTILYIDGFNLYYGAVKGTPHKWLDVVKLFSSICHEQNPSIEIVAVKYFTAPVKGSIATHGEQAVQSQNAYLKALRTLYPNLIEVIEGYFVLEEAGLPRYQKPLVKTDRLQVWKLEEKKTDVHLAIQMYRDACHGVEHQVLVSNDSDLVPALEAIRADYPRLTIGVVMPRLKRTGSDIRPTNTELDNLAHWTRHHIHENELAAAQLPNLIPTKKKPIYKPTYW